MLCINTKTGGKGKSWLCPKLKLHLATVKHLKAALINIYILTMCNVKAVVSIDPADNYDLTAALQH